ncbi:MAG: type I pullulanase [Ruminococcus sp.]|nr:type I pullulanase [Ruminococcus sp.]
MKMRGIVAVLLVMVLLSTMAVFGTNAADTDQNATGAYYNQNKYSNQTYSGNDLGATYSPSQTVFKVWSPDATKVQVKIYKTGSDRENGAGVIGTYDMTKNNTNGVWSYTLAGDHKNQYYTYLVTAKNTNGTVETNETQDIYSKAVGVNGDRSMIVDLDSTDPDGWDDDKHVVFNNMTEAAVWELHIRDFSADPNSGISEENRGDYLAFTEGGTTLKGDPSVTTGIDYLVEQGVNCVQLMPFADFDQLDETYGDSAENRNWGYNPKNYNVPDGAYTSNPYDGNVRITEVKKMIQALHDRGIAVVMDVVYNHTAGYEASCFTKTVPGYYYRMSSATQYVNGSGQGCELASENAMCRNYIVQSLLYWVQEYHIDGFRFDLMGCIDCTTLNTARQQLNNLYPDGTGKKILMYGEPWTGGDSAVQTGPSASNARTALNSGVGVFSEGMNDDAVNVKASGGASVAGWISGNGAKAATVVNGIKANIIDTNNNNKTVNYIDNHDNYTVWDKITGASTSSGEGKKTVSSAPNKDSTSEAYTGQLKLAGALYMTSQGIKFMNAGTEFARTKNGQRNSYNSPDSINMLDWKRAKTYSNVVEYYKGLRQINDVYTPFHDDSTTSKNTMSFKSSSGTLIAYTINNNTANKANEWGTVAVCLNSGSAAATVNLGSSGWTIVANDKQAGVKSLGTVDGSSYTVPARSAAILVQSSSYKDFSDKYKYGKLTTNHYVNGQLTKTTTAKYKIGTKYHALKDDDILIHNNLTKTEGTASGTFTGDTTVSYYYESNGKTMATLKVDYVSQTGASLTPSMSYLLEVGDEYSIPVCAVEGYQLDTDKYPSGTTGKFTGTNTTIKFTYKPLDTQEVIVHYYRSQSAWGNNVYCYAYTDDGEEPLGAWSYQKSGGGFMSPDSSKGAGWFTITIKGYASCKVMFHGAANQSQEPGQNEPGYAVAGECFIQNKVVTYDSTIITSYIDIDTGKKLKPDSSVSGQKKSTETYTTTGDNSLGTLVATPANASGFCSPGVVNVVYLYRTGAAPTDPPTSAPTEPSTPAQTEPTTLPSTPALTDPPTSAPAVGETSILGDANLDGEVNINDVTFIQQYLVNLRVYTPTNFRNSDVDGNGKVTIKDANYIQRYIVGINVPFDINKTIS